MIYLYAITVPEAVADEEELLGIEDAPVRLIEAAGTAAACSRHRERPGFREEEMLAHERTVEALMEFAPVLPARFGTMLSDEPAVREHLAAGGARYAAALERVRGRVELGLRVLGGGEAPPEAAPADAGVGRGTAYLTAKLAREADVAELADAIEPPLIELAHEHRRRRAVVPGVVLDTAFLIDSDRVEEFVHEVDRLAEEHASATVLCTGPWPPYNFVERGNGGR